MAVLGTSVCKPDESSGDKKGRPSKFLNEQKGFFLT